MVLTPNKDKHRLNRRLCWMTRRNSIDWKYNWSILRKWLGKRGFILDSLLSIQPSIYRSVVIAIEQQSWSTMGKTKKKTNLWLCCCSTINMNLNIIIKPRRPLPFVAGGFAARWMIDSLVGNECDGQKINCGQWLRDKGHGRAQTPTPLLSVLLCNSQSIV